MADLMKDLCDFGVEWRPSAARGQRVQPKTLLIVTFQIRHKEEPSARSAGSLSNLDARYVAGLRRSMRQPWRPGNDSVRLHDDDGWEQLASEDL
jgi:hypothetical protein